MMEPRLKLCKNRTVDRWRRLGYEILKNNFILTWNHGFNPIKHGQRDARPTVAFPAALVAAS